MKTYYITFRSITFAQRAERLLRQGGVECQMQRTPKWMEQRGCGYCLRIRPADTLRSLELMKRGNASYSKLYAQTEGGKVEELPV